MAPVMTAELPTTDFGIWARRARLIFPAPLDTGFAARVALPWDELLQVSEDRIEVRNAVGKGQTVDGARAERAARDVPKPVREILSRAEPMLREPQSCLFAGRTDDADQATLAVGLIRGAEGLVVVDTEETVRLIQVASSDVAATVIGIFPPPRPARITTTEMNSRALEVVEGGIGAKGADRRATAGFAASGVSEATAEVLVRLQRQSSAQGMIGAIRFVEGQPLLNGRDATWSEGAPGAVLRRNMGDGVFRFEPASRASLISAAIAAMSGAK